MVLQTTLWWIMSILILSMVMTFFLKKKGSDKIAGRITRNNVLLVLGIGAVAVGLVAGNVINLSGFGVDVLDITSDADDLADDVEDVDTGAACPPGSVEDVTVTISAQDKFTSVATGGTHRYRVNNGIAKTVSDAGTFSASGGDVIEVLFQNASTSGDYLSTKTSVKLDCGKGTQEISDKVAAQNGTITVNIFNSKGDQIDGDANNETIGAGDVKSLKVELSGQNKREFKYGLTAVVEYNDTAFDSIGLTSSDITVTPLSGAPAAHKISSTDNIVKAYKIGAISGSAIKLLTLDYDADDDENPTDDGGAENDPTIYLYVNNYFINEDTGGSFDGPAVEDEDNVLTYGLKSATRLHTI